MNKKTILQKLNFTSKPPLGVKILSMLYLIQCLFAGVFAVFLVFVAARIQKVSILLFTLFLAAFAFFSFYVARGLWNGKNWARIVLVVLFSISLLVNLSYLVIFRNFIMPQLFISIFISTLVLTYLLFEGSARKHFGLNQNLKKDKEKI